MPLALESLAACIALRRVCSAIVAGQDVTVAAVAIMLTAAEADRIAASWRADASFAAPGTAPNLRLHAACTPTR